MDLTERVLNSLRGRLGIMVSHPARAGGLKVTGATNDAVRFGWNGMPEALKVPDRVVLRCRTEWSSDLYYVFEDETTIVDAPADMVVEAMLDLVGQINPDAADRLYSGEEEEEDGPDPGVLWNDTSAELT